MYDNSDIDVEKKMKSKTLKKKTSTPKLKFYSLCYYGGHYLPEYYFVDMC